MMETFLTVLDGFGAFPIMIERELDRFLPFLATTKILMAAVQSGVGRESAHEIVREHAVATALAMREMPDAQNDLLEKLAADPRHDRESIYNERPSTVSTLQSQALTSPRMYGIKLTYNF